MYRVENTKEPQVERLWANPGKPDPDIYIWAMNKIKKEHLRRYPCPLTEKRNYLSLPITRRMEWTPARRKCR
jgi:hypothetical protein